MYVICLFGFVFGIILELYILSILNMKNEFFNIKWKELKFFVFFFMNTFELQKKCFSTCTLKGFK